MTAPGLPPHLCHEQRVDDHCKDSIVAYTKKQKWPAARYYSARLMARPRTLKLVL